jgi:hypothetical protein
VAGGWLLFAAVVRSWLPLSTVLVGLGIIGAGAAVALFAEWRATRALNGLLHAVDHGAA